MTGISQDVIVQYAPYILIVIAFCCKNKIFVTPAQLQKERKGIIEEVETKFLSLVAFREFEKRIDSNFNNIKVRFDDGSARFDKIDRNLEHIKDILIDKKG